MKRFEYQTRVVEEKDQLDDRISKLNFFINDNPSFKEDIDSMEQVRLELQLFLMKKYSEILKERIHQFG